MPLQQTTGNVTADAFGGGVAAIPNYIEDVFSTYLYTGNNSTKTINNGIDLSTKGGLVWIKSRASAYDNVLIDTARGRSSEMSSDLAYSAATFGSPVASGSDLTSFNTDGFSLGTNYKNTNASGDSLVSWTFRKQPKFFDCFTFVGDGTTNRKIAHSLGSVPGFMLVKSVTTNRTWNVYHRSLGNAQSMSLETTDAAASSTIWNSTTPTATEFTVQGEGNLSGNTYIVYLYAHDAGGFGLTGTDNVISCGSFTTNGSGNATVNLGYEPQYVLYKKTSTTGQWYIEDTMRGLYAPSQVGATLIANLPNAEGAGNGSLWLNSTGFTVNPAMNLGTSTDCIYIAIRRGPMKVPTAGTKVFDVQFEGNVPDSQKPGTRSSTGYVDMAIRAYRPGLTDWPKWYSRLNDTETLTSTTNAAAVTAQPAQFDYSNGWLNGTFSSTVTSQIDYMFKRAPSFFDVVCYTGTGAGSPQAITHNLTVVPELIFIKGRTNAYSWPTYSKTTTPNELNIDQNFAAYGAGAFSSASPTSTQFTVASNAANQTSATYIAYLFATCAGVSKVGSYTGTGTTQQINCGFTAGSRFVMIKRTDSTGDWYVWDTARGIVSGNDPHLSLNTTTAEVTTDDTIDPDSSGFIVNQLSATNVNVNAATYIYLAIA